MNIHTPALAQLVEDIKIIDVDTHFTEPHDLWTKRAPAALKDKVPRVIELNGTRSWVIDDSTIIGLGAKPTSAVYKDGSRDLGMDFQKYTIEDVHPGSYAVQPRLEVMDQTGIAAQVLNPNILGFGGQNTSKVAPDLRLATVQIYNDAMAELQETSGHRLFPMALLPWWDITAAIEELQRTRKMGLRGINIHSDPHTHLDPDGNRLPDLGATYWDPLWEACQDLEVPINFHIGASEQSMDWMGDQGWPSLPLDYKAGLSGAMLFINNGRVMGNLILSGLFDRHPRLKFVSVESGMGWILFILEAIDYQYENINWGNHPLQKMPSEYFRSNFYATY